MIESEMKFKHKGETKSLPLKTFKNKAEMDSYRVKHPTGLAKKMRSAGENFGKIDHKEVKGIKKALDSYKKAPSPFRIVKDTFKTVGKVARKGVQKGVDFLMEPSIRVMKIHDAKMREMNRKAKAGEFN
jgi:hypothetical protein